MSAFFGIAVWSRVVLSDAVPIMREQEHLSPHPSVGRPNKWKRELANCDLDVKITNYSVYFVVLAKSKNLRVQFNFFVLLYGVPTRELLLVLLV